MRRFQSPLHRAAQYALAGLCWVSPVAWIGAQQAVKPLADTIAAESARAPLTKARQRVIPLPVLGSAPETGFQFGATVLGVREPATAWHARPASLMMYAIFTAENQRRFGAESEWWSRENTWRVAGTVQWQRFPLPYYGVGDSTSKSSAEIFTPQGVEVTGTVQRRVAASMFVLAAVRYADQSIHSDSLTGAIHRGEVLGSSGGQTAQLTVGALHDTRDNLYAARKGHLLQVTWTDANRAYGSDFRFGRLRTDARQYVAVGARHTLAFQLQIQGTTGDAPFDQLALIGGSDIMRGYAKGRYRDQWMAASQVEWRQHIVRQLHGAVFGGAGTVAPNAANLLNGRVLPTYGAGLRWQLDRNQRTAVRLDLGRGSRGASGLYVAFNEAF